jgi:hypothetical protein
VFLALLLVTLALIAVGVVFVYGHIYGMPLE